MEDTTFVKHVEDSALCYTCNGCLATKEQNGDISLLFEGIVSPTVSVTPVTKPKELGLGQVGENSVTPVTKELGLGENSPNGNDSIVRTHNSCCQTVPASEHLTGLIKNLEKTIVDSLQITGSKHLHLQVANLEQTVSSKDKKIKELNIILDAKNKEINKLNQQIKGLSKTNSNSNTNRSDTSIGLDSKQQARQQETSTLASKICQMGEILTNLCSKVSSMQETQTKEMSNVLSEFDKIHKQEAVENNSTPVNIPVHNRFAVLANTSPQDGPNGADGKISTQAVGLHSHSQSATDKDRPTLTQEGPRVNGSDF